MLAIIAGSGLYDLETVRDKRVEHVQTAYGSPSSPLIFGHLDGYPCVFMTRHGQGHSVPPHRINYRANIAALAACNPQAVVAVYAVGGVQAPFTSGALAVPDQIIDYTYGRAHTFFDDEDQPVVHVDFTHPYDQALRQKILRSGQGQDIALIDHGVYAATQGPRLESAAEIRRIGQDGGQLVGMTGMPEAALVREKSLAFAAICVVVNAAAGVGDSTESIDLSALQTVLDQGMGQVVRLLSDLAGQL